VRLKVRLCSPASTVILKPTAEVAAAKGDDCIGSAHVENIAERWSLPSAVTPGFNHSPPRPTIPCLQDWIARAFFDSLRGVGFGPGLGRTVQDEMPSDATRAGFPSSVLSLPGHQPVFPGGRVVGIKGGHDGNPACLITYECSSVTQPHSRWTMNPKLTKLELRIMEALWVAGRASIREIQETFPQKERPAYTTIQTTVYRLEAKNALRRVKRVGNFHIFEAAISRDDAQRRLIDDLLALFGGRSQPVMARLIECGKLTLDDVKDAEKTLRNLARKDHTQ
jgi:BlaI family transcriptional regulator, penicillinase repressor